MIVKYRKAFFTDLGKITQLKYIKDIEFITEIAHTAKTLKIYQASNGLGNIREKQELKVCRFVLV